VGRGVIYYVQGTRHAAVMAVSMMTLRDHYAGDVTILCGDDAAKPYADAIAADARASVRMFEGKQQRRHAGYATKPTLPGRSPYDETVLIDADTAVIGSIEELFPTHRREWVLTRYSDWVTTGNIVSSRIKRWLKVAPTEAHNALARSRPALNTGVMGWGCESEAALVAWPEMASRLPKVFISDETAADLIWQKYPEEVRLLDDRWNWSPLFGASPYPKVRVIHWHGKKHIKRVVGLKLWWPFFLRSWTEHSGGIQQWAPGGDTYLAEKLGLKAKR